jgi:hypothetical protein
MFPLRKEHYHAVPIHTDSILKTNTLPKSNNNKKGNTNIRDLTLKYVQSRTYIFKRLEKCTCKPINIYIFPFFFETLNPLNQLP